MGRKSNKKKKKTRSRKHSGIKKLPENSSSPIKVVSSSEETTGDTQQLNARINHLILTSPAQVKKFIDEAENNLNELTLYLSGDRSSLPESEMIQMTKELSTRNNLSLPAVLMIDVDFRDLDLNWVKELMLFNSNAPFIIALCAYTHDSPVTEFETSLSVFMKNRKLIENTSLKLALCCPEEHLTDLKKIARKLSFDYVETVQSVPLENDVISLRDRPDSQHSDNSGSDINNNYISFRKKSGSDNKCKEIKLPCLGVFSPIIWPDSTMSFCTRDVNRQALVKTDTLPIVQLSHCLGCRDAIELCQNCSVPQDDPLFSTENALLFAALNDHVLTSDFGFTSDSNTPFFNKILSLAEKDWLDEQNSSRLFPIAMAALCKADSLEKACSLWNEHASQEEINIEAASLLLKALNDNDRIDLLEKIDITAQEIPPSLILYTAMALNRLNRKTKALELILKYTSSSIVNHENESDFSLLNLEKSRFLRDFGDYQAALNALLEIPAHLRKDVWNLEHETCTNLLNPADDPVDETENSSNKDGKSESSTAFPLDTSTSPSFLSLDEIFMKAALFLEENDPLNALEVIGDYSHPLSDKESDVKNRLLHSRALASVSRYNEAADILDPVQEQNLDFEDRFFLISTLYRRSMSDHHEISERFKTLVRDIPSKSSEYQHIRIQSLMMTAEIYLNTQKPFLALKILADLNDNIKFDFEGFRPLLSKAVQATSSEMEKQGNINEAYDLLLKNYHLIKDPSLFLQACALMMKVHRLNDLLTQTFRVLTENSLPEEHAAEIWMYGARAALELSQNNTNKGSQNIIEKLMEISKNIDSLGHIPEAQFYIASLQFRASNHNAALKHFENACYLLEESDLSNLDKKLLTQCIKGAGLSAMTLKNWAAAAKHFRMLPLEENLHYLMNALINSHSYSEALEIFNATPDLPKEKMNFFQTLTYAAYANKLSGNLEEAIALYRKALNIFQNGDIYVSKDQILNHRLTLAECLHDLGMYEESLYELENIDKNTGNAGILKRNCQKQIENQKSELSSASKINIEKNDLENVIDVSIKGLDSLSRYFHDDLFEEAIDLYESLPKTSLNRDHHILAALAMLKTEKWAEAAELLQLDGILANEEENLASQLIIALVMADNVSRAMEVSRNISQISNDALNILVKSLYRNDPAASIELMDKYSDAVNNDLSLKEIYINSLISLERFTEVLEQSVILAPAFFKYRLTCLKELKRMDEASSILIDHSDCDEFLAEHHFDLAEYFENIGEKEKSVNHYLLYLRHEKQISDNPQILRALKAVIDGDEFQTLQSQAEQTFFTELSVSQYLDSTVFSVQSSKFPAALFLLKSLKNTSRIKLTSKEIIQSGFLMAFSQYMLNKPEDALNVLFTLPVNLCYMRLLRGLCLKASGSIEQSLLELKAACDLGCKKCNGFLADTLMEAERNTEAFHALKAVFSEDNFTTEETCIYCDMIPDEKNYNKLGIDLSNILIANGNSKDALELLTFLDMDEMPKIAMQVDALILLGMEEEALELLDSTVDSTDTPVVSEQSEELFELQLKALCQLGDRLFNKAEKTGIAASKESLLNEAHSNYDLCCQLLSDSENIDITSEYAQNILIRARKGKALCSLALCDWERADEEFKFPEIQTDSDLKTHISIIQENLRKDEVPENEQKREVSDDITIINLDEQSEDDRIYHEAAEDFEAEKYKSSLQKLLQIENHLPEHKRLISVIYHRTGEDEKAAAELLSIEEHLSLAELLDLAILQITSGHYKQALEILQKLLLRFNNYTEKNKLKISENEIKITMAEAYLCLRQNQKCIDCLSGLQNNWKVNYLRGAALRNSDPQLALQELQKASRIEPGYEALELLTTHLIYIKNHESAATALQELIKHRPVEENYRNLALCLKECKRYKEALTYSLKISKPQTEDLRLRTHLYRETGESEKASETLSLIEKESMKPEDYLLLGRMLLKEGRYEDATSPLLEAATSIPLSYRDLAKAYKSLNDENSAIESLEKIPQELCNSSDYLLMSQLASNLGDNEKSLQYIRIYLNREPWDRNAAETLSAMLLQKKRNSQ